MAVDQVQHPVEGGIRAALLSLRQKRVSQVDQSRWVIRITLLTTTIHDLPEVSHGVGDSLAIVSG